MDWSFAIALALGVAGFLAFVKLRGKPPALPRCAACQLGMEPVGDMVAPSDPMLRYPLGMSDQTLFGHSRVRIYQCPGCLGRQRIRS